MTLSDLRDRIDTGAITTPHARALWLVVTRYRHAARNCGIPPDLTGEARLIAALLASPEATAAATSAEVIGGPSALFSWVSSWAAEALRS